MGEREWNEAVAWDRRVRGSRRGNAAVAVRERVENKESPPIHAVPLCIIAATGAVLRTG